ncbi:MAG: regulatory protein RecX [Firmicutes bacterium]|nr:regulatory protein RecX [Bacillota bacterium]
MTWQKSRKTNDLASAPDKILSAALAYLAKREYSELELHRKLLNRGADEAAVATALNSLKEKHYLDDARYAAAYVRDRREFRPCGVAVLKRELTAKGVAMEIIDAAIEEEYDEERQRQALRQLLLKAAAIATSDDDEQIVKYRSKIIRRMLAKGFPQSMVWDEIDFLLTGAGR